MKLIAEIIDKDAHREFHRFLEATGIVNWERKIAKLNSLPKFRSPSPNAYLNYLASRNPLVSAIETYLSLERDGKSLRKNATPELMKACGYIKVINSIFHQGKAAAVRNVQSLVLDDETVRSFCLNSISQYISSVGVTKLSLSISKTQPRTIFW